MTLRTAALAVLLTTCVALPATTASARADPAVDGQFAGGPEPLWVPDPEQVASAREEPSPGAVEVSAPVAVDSAAVDDPSRVAVAHWMAGLASDAGLPGELPVMASLVESGLRNLAYGDADSVGFFQMRLGIWNSGEYEGYLARPELQVSWFISHALAIRDARYAAGDATFGEDPATWGDWIADVEQPYSGYRGRYQLRLDEARTLLAEPAPAVAPFELGLTVGGPGAPAAATSADPTAQRVLDDGSITLDPRAASDLQAGRVDPRVSTVLLDAAAQSPIAVTVIQTGHSYYTVTGSVSNHSSGRAVDIGMVGGEPVSSTNEAAHALALAIGRLPASERPTEIGSPWAIDEPGYFTDSDHQDHLHIGFDDSAAAGAGSVAAAATDDEATGVSAVPVATAHASAPAEPHFAAGAPGAHSGAANPGEPSFEAAP